MKVRYWLVKDREQMVNVRLEVRLLSNLVDPRRSWMLGVTQDYTKSLPYYAGPQQSKATSPCGGGVAFGARAQLGIRLQAAVRELDNSAH